MGTTPTPIGRTGEPPPPRVWTDWKYYLQSSFGSGILTSLSEQWTPSRSAQPNLSKQVRVVCHAGSLRLCLVQTKHSPALTLLTNTSERGVHGIHTQLGLISEIFLCTFLLIYCLQRQRLRNSIVIKLKRIASHWNYIGQSDNCRKFPLVNLDTVCCSLSDCVRSRSGYSAIRQSLKMQMQLRKKKNSNEGGSVGGR